jgi:hypothetical protein
VVKPGVLRRMCFSCLILERGGAEMNCDTTYLHTRRSWALVYVYEAFFSSVVTTTCPVGAPYVRELAKLEASRACYG